ncbi:MAG: CHASE2 domain-containing protein, partial [Parahaliea sp.]
MMLLAPRVLARRTALGAVVGLLCLFIAHTQFTAPLERMLYDLAISLDSEAPAPATVLVAIDDQSLAELGRWPWPRERHVELLRQLREAGAKVVAMDIIFSEPEVEYPEVDALLAEEIRAHGRVVLPIHFANLGPLGRIREVFPSGAIALSAAALGHVHVEIDPDGVARGLFLREGVNAARWPHFTLAALQLMSAPRPSLPGARNPQTSTDNPGSRIVRDYFNLVPLNTPLAEEKTAITPKVSYVDVIKRRVPPEQFRDRLVFVGITAAGLGDNIATAKGRIPGVEWNLNAYSALAGDRLIQPATDSLRDLLFFAVTLLCVLWVTHTPPQREVLTLTGIILAIVASTLVILHLGRLWISPAPPVLALLIAFPLWSWLNLRAVMRLIRDQLKALDIGRPWYASDVYWEGLEQRARLLVEAGYLETWHLEVPTSPSSRRNRSDQWQHLRQHSWRSFHNGDITRTLHLHWQPSAPSPARTVNRLFAYGSGEATQRNYRGDVDLTRIRSAFQTAREFRELIDNAIDRLGSGVIVTDISGTILFYNQEASDLLGKQAATINVQTLLAAITPEEGI